MPMTWDAAADAKLFTVVMAVYDIKISGPQNEKIARLMGDDVTAKAITHRLSKIKAHASALDPSTPASSRKRNTPTTKPTSSRSATSSKATGKGSNNNKHLSATHTVTTLMHDTGSDDEEDFSATPSKSSSFSINATNVSSKKRKFGNLGKAPKIEDADEAGFFPGMGGDEEDVGDAIDFSVGYHSNTANTNSNLNTIKTETNNNNKEETIDLTAEEDTNGGAEKHTKTAVAKGKGKQGGYLPVIKKEIIEVEDMVSADEDEDDEMAI